MRQDRQLAAVNRQKLRLLLLTLLAVLSWIAGLVIYLLALRIIYGESISSGDFGAVAFWSAITCLIAMPLAYVPAMFVTRYLLNGVNPVGALPLVGVLVSVIPVILLWALLGGFDMGGIFSALLSPESLLFNFHFAGTGAVFGLRFARIYRSEMPANPSLEPPKVGDRRAGDAAAKSRENGDRGSRNAL